MAERRMCVCFWLFLIYYMKIVDSGHDVFSLLLKMLVFLKAVF